MRFAFSSNAFRRYRLTEAIRLLSETGYRGIEIMADLPHAYPPLLSGDDLEEIEDSLARYHMQVANINAFTLHAEGDTYHPSWIERDPSRRALRIAHTLNCIDLAGRLGARTVSTEPGGPLEGMSSAEGLRLFREGLEAVAPRARHKGVRVLIEPEPGLLIENSDQFLSFFEGLDPAVFGCNFDIGHFFCVGEECAATVARLGAHIHHFHLEDIAPSREHIHLVPGDGAIDFGPVLDAVEALGYEGFVTVELYTCEDNPVGAARRALAYLRGLTASAPEQGRRAGGALWRSA